MISRPAVQAIVFDFDGVILDTESPILAEWQAEYARLGHELRMEWWEQALGSHGRFDPHARLEELSGGPIDREGLRLELRSRIMPLCEAQPLLPGVRDRLAEARELGLGTAVASSSTLEWVGGWLERHELRAAFDAVCTRDDVVHTKPAPDLFLLAAERLGVPPGACLVVEDSPNGIAAARAAGCRVVAVPNAVTRELDLSGADLRLASLAEAPLTEILRRVG